ncbi:ead/Ea22-like family protein [Cronobacter sakazakii]|uniref:ead/Ea22-like family protein n=1 Tax=Cronobacter sakazakii TaxID=28141 RepID=UPI0009BB1F2C|nr:ead/Ea22-like family protein [Cronobacter sakazakii]ELY2932159.1 ead/Ea22-like family protein [Cronobacter sakazakii]PUX69167.1 hypothetical protein BS420_04740 [Cronobacter sakazakii]
MTDTAKLKAAAEKATPGPWRRTATIFNGITYGPFSLTNEKVLANVAEKANAEFIAAANPTAVLELIAALEAAEKRNAELTDALKQAVNGYKSCLRTGHERIVELGGECDEPEVMIAGNPDIRLAEKVLAAGINLETGGVSK